MNEEVVYVVHNLTCFHCVVLLVYSQRMLWVFDEHTVVWLHARQISDSLSTPCEVFSFSFPHVQPIADFDLHCVHYEVKSPKCHELSLAAPPHDKMSFNFRCEQEAQEWATVVVSSLREAHRGQPS